MNKISFKKALNNRAKELAIIAKEIWTEHYVPIIGKDQVEYMLANFQSQKTISDQINQGFEYYFIKHNSASIGYFSIIPKDGVLFLSKIYIKSSFQGKGYGRIAIDFISKLAQEKNLFQITLTVNKHNHNSIEAYKKFGFKIVKSIILDIGNGFVMDDYVMSKTL